MNKRAVSQWNKNAKVWDKLQGEEGDINHKLFIDPAIVKLLGDIAEKNILDAGCGNGYWTRRLAKKAKKVTGIDFSSDLLKIAKNKNNPPNTEFLMMDAGGNLDFPSIKFDIILSSMVLHYVHDLSKTSKEFKRVLKPGGIAVIVVQHPIYQLYFRAQDKAGLKSDIFRKTAGYFERIALPQLTFFGKAVFNINSRPLEDYITPFLDNGFVLSGFVEPEMPKELVKIYPKYKRLREVPRVVILKFQKLHVSV